MWGKLVIIPISFPISWVLFRPIKIPISKYSQISLKAQWCFNYSSEGTSNRSGLEVEQTTFYKDVFFPHLLSLKLVTFYRRNHVSYMLRIYF